VPLLGLIVFYVTLYFQENINHVSGPLNERHGFKRCFLFVFADMS